MREIMTERRQTQQDWVQIELDERPRRHIPPATSLSSRSSLMRSLAVSGAPGMCDGESCVSRRPLPSGRDRRQGAYAHDARERVKVTLDGELVRLDTAVLYGVFDPIVRSYSNKCNGR